MRSQNAIKQHIGEKAQALQVASGRLGTLNPFATLARGYSVCTDSSGNTVTDALQVREGDQVEVQLSHGKLVCRVLKGEVDV